MEAGSYPVYESFESFCLAILQGWWRSKVQLWRELRVQGYMARKLHQERFEGDDGQFLEEELVFQAVFELSSDLSAFRELSSGRWRPLRFRRPGASTR